MASPDDGKVIVSACESTPYGISTDVKRQDRFWIKSQPYSLADLLANDDSVDQFVGGTVYQAFLSATNYHRWHSPVAGTIVRAFVVAGTYYSEADSEGADAVEPMNSQSYLAHVAARAVILIEAEDPAIGLMAFVAVGMSEVSSCLIGSKVTPGYHVGKGEELGYFQYGGSTHCLVFRPGAIRRVRPRGHSPAARPQGAADARPLEARHRQHAGLSRGGWPHAYQPAATARPVPYGPAGRRCVKVCQTTGVGHDDLWLITAGGRPVGRLQGLITTRGRRSSRPYHPFFGALLDTWWGGTVTSAGDRNPQLLGYEDGACPWTAFFRADRRRGH